ncbi:hypothetical protein ACFQ4M_04615 [Thauera mechernichensis]|uniref:Uncharacterized protein n=1 Tax=Thauera mechernichensis TaxID=82788 RepID=A0ABW3WA49_9RHOO|nr:hypothetical protein [Thauera mechernichensis]MDG3066159.1 hypothetical protein [Thauera mechernichensis]
MSKSFGPWRTQVVSDVIRDGLGLELLDGKNQITAEVFRCDANHTVSVSLFVEEVPLLALEMLVARAKERLDPFEDGMSFGEALGD